MIIIGALKNRVKIFGKIFREQLFAQKGHPLKEKMGRRDNKVGGGGYPRRGIGVLALFFPIFFL
jgi:hypothetical protein